MIEPIHHSPIPLIVMRNNSGNKRVQFLNIDYENHVLAVFNLDYIDVLRHVLWTPSSTQETLGDRAGGALCGKGDDKSGVVRGDLLVSGGGEIYQFSIPSTPEVASEATFTCSVK